MVHQEVGGDLVCTYIGLFFPFKMSSVQNTEMYVQNKVMACIFYSSPA